MKYKNAYALSLSMLLLSGCAYNQKPFSKIEGERVINLKSGGAVKTYTYLLLETDTQKPTDTELRVITKMDTSAVAAAKVASLVGVFLLGGSVSQSTFSKHDLKGTRIMTVINPVMNDFVPRMNDVIEYNLDIANSTDEQNNVVIVKPTDFYLVYSELAGGDNYELRYKLSVETAYPGKYNFDCSFTSGNISLDEWERNGYQKVKEVTKIKIADCLSRFGSESNLKSLAAGLGSGGQEKVKAI